MKLNGYDSWPFLAAHMRTPEEDARWWNECYVVNELSCFADAIDTWTILGAGPGNGKSTFFQVLKRTNPNSIFIDYPVSKLSTSHAEEEIRHLYQIEKLASQALREILQEHPELLKRLADSQKEYLRWLIEKFNDSRAYKRWLALFPPEQEVVMAGIAFSDIYPSQENMTDDASGQIEELVGIFRRCDYQKIILCVDIAHKDTNVCSRVINSLFAWLELMQHVGLLVAAALPTELLENGNLIGETRSRVKIRQVRVQPEISRKIVERAVKCATNKRLSKLSQLFSLDLQKRIEKIILAQYGAVAPGGWMRFAELGLELAGNRELPLGLEIWNEIGPTYYRKYAPLALDSHPCTILRGFETLTMEMAPFELFERLWYSKGTPLLIEDLSYKTDYGYKLISRVRQVIEPDPKVPIYLKGQRNDGYWLENCQFEGRH